MKKHPGSRPENLAEVLTDPQRKRKLLASLKDDGEAQTILKTWIEETETAGDSSFLETGAGLIGPAWERIRERLSTLDDLTPGQKVGRYLVLHKVGAGGMGSVYAAYDPELDRKVAIKVLHSRLFASDEAEIATERLRQEARSLAQLSHPHVVAVHDVGTIDDQLFLAMEFVDGCDAAAWLKQEQRTAAETVDLYLRAGQGLAAAHSAGLVHRDFKPHNVLVGGDGRVLVADFGLSRPVLEGDGPSPDDLELVPVYRLTRVGAVLGTPAYMAPEQLDGRDFDERSDQFAFSVSLWESLFGERPFRGRTLAELAGSFSKGKLSDPSESKKVPVAVRKVLERGLNIDPELRYASMDSLLEDLERAPNQSKRRLLLAGLVVLSLVAVGLVYRSSTDPSQVCRGSRSQLQGVWDAPRQDAIRQAFMATDQPFSADAWSSAESSLNRYAETWVEHRREACEATRVREEQSPELMDLRMICLEERRLEFGAVSDLFTQADVQVVLKSSNAVSSLGSLEACEDGAALIAKGPLPPDAEKRAVVSALQGRHAELKVLWEVGKAGDASEALAILAAQAEVTSYLPLLAQIHFLAGRVEIHESRLEKADFELGKALSLAIESRDDRFSGLISAHLIYLKGIRMGRYDDGHAWARLARAWLARTGNNDELRALILRREAMIFGEEGRTEEAEASAALALEGARATFGPSDPRLARYLTAMAIQKRISGNLEGALELFLDALDLLTAGRGRHHPETIPILTHLGGLFDEMSRLEEAESSLDQALELIMKAHGRDHAQTGRILTALGSVVARAGRYDDALDLQRQALEVFEALYDDDNILLAHPLGGIGEILVRTERWSEAVVPLERMLTILEQDKTRNGLMGICKLLLAEAYWQETGNVDRSNRLLREARPGLVEAGAVAADYLPELDEFANVLSAEL